MLEIERIIDNKPIRPPVISTLQMRGLISHGKYAFFLLMLENNVLLIEFKYLLCWMEQM